MPAWAFHPRLHAVNPGGHPTHPYGRFTRHGHSTHPYEHPTCVGIPPTLASSPSTWAFYPPVRPHGHPTHSYEHSTRVGIPPTHHARARGILLRWAPAFHPHTRAWAHRLCIQQCNYHQFLCVYWCRSAHGCSSRSSWQCTGVSLASWNAPVYANIHAHPCCCSGTGAAGSRSCSVVL